MKYLVLLFTLLLVLTVSCRPGTPTVAPTATPLVPDSIPPGGQNPCGDGLCNGPENATNCPQDCPPPTQAAQPTKTPAGAEPGPEPDSYWVTNPTSGARLYVQVVHPQDWDGSPLPTLVLVPGGTGDSSRFLETPSQAQRMADDGLTIVVFDPDGRGRSEGVEDDDGYTHQDGLAAIIRFVATLPEVDAARIGLVSYSYGVTMATGALARHPDLPVQFLIDWEGPANRDDTGGCDEAHLGHLKEHDCDDEAFWREREAATFALQLPVPYQRLQSEKDHVQPDNDHALLMIANATAKEYGGHGIAPWTRLNDLEPNTVYSTADPPPMLSEQETKHLEPLVVRYALELFDLFAASAPSDADQPTPSAPAQADILLTVDAAPSGETIRPLLGVGGGPLPADRRSNNPVLTEQYHAIGVTMIRTHDLGGPLDMATMYPDQNADPHDPASYDFEASDQVFAAIVEGGFEPYLRLGDSMGTAPGMPTLESRAPTNPDNWVQAAVEVVRHYDELSRQAGVPLRYVEIWNEPNFKQFWDATPREFYDLFAKTAAALKAEFPHLMIGGPGLASSGGSLTPEGEQYTQRFLDYLQQHNTPLDFFSWHVYSSDAAIYVQLATYYRQQLDAHGYTETESHITEWNTAMQGEDETDAVRNTARGAALMTAAWIGLQEGGVAVSTFYRGNESGQHGNMGLFYADGRAKPMALAFSLWAEMAAHPQRLAVTPTGSDDPNRLWVLAGQDERGEVALLIANPTDTPTSWEALFAGRDLVEGATLYQVSDASDEVQVSTLETPAAEIGAYTVQLLIATAVIPPPTATSTVVAPSPTATSAVVIPIGGVNEADPVVKPLLGVVSGPDQPPDSPAPNLTDHFHDIGVITVRNNDYFDDRMDMEGIFNCGGPTYPSWEGCDPQDEANYYWEASDALFESWLSGGFEPFLRLGGEVQNATRRHDFKGPQNAIQEENWIQAAQKVVDRYLHWGGQAQTFTYLDIWTEFPNKSFWDRSNIAFFRFWTQAFVTLKAAYPELKIGGPGFVASQAIKVVEGEKSAAQDFLAYLYENKVKPDWIGWHLFYNDPLMWHRAAQAYRDLLDGKGLYADVPWAGSGFFDDVELIVDAYGVARMGLTPQEQDQIYNHQKGAAIRTASWIAMQYGDVERAYLYRSGDPHTSPNDDLESISRGNYTGLFYGDAQATYKPAAHAFRLWSQVVSRFPTLLTTPLPPTEATGGLWVLAARNDQGQIAVLVSNVTANDVAWTLAFDGATMEDYQVEIYQVDDQDDGRTAHPWSGGAVTIPAESVQLVILEPEG